MAGNTVGVLEGICWEVVKAMVGVGLEYFWDVEAACVLGGYWEVVVAGVVELAMGEGRLQAGAKARWLQLLMEGSYLGKSSFKAWTIHISENKEHLVPAGHRYLWPFPGPVHRRKEEHDLGSGWKPEEGHGTAAEE